MLAIVWLALGRADAGILRRLTKPNGHVSAPETQEHTPRRWRAAQRARNAGTPRAKTANFPSRNQPNTAQDIGNHLTCILHK